MERTRFEIGSRIDRGRRRKKATISDDIQTTSRDNRRKRTRTQTRANMDTEHACNTLDKEGGEMRKSYSSCGWCFRGNSRDVHIARAVLKLVCICFSYAQLVIGCRYAGAVVHAATYPLCHASRRRLIALYLCLCMLYV